MEDALKAVREAHAKEMAAIIEENERVNSRVAQLKEALAKEHRKRKEAQSTVVRLLALLEKFSDAMEASGAPPPMPSPKTAAAIAVATPQRGDDAVVGDDVVVAGDDEEEPPKAMKTVAASPTKKRERERETVTQSAKKSTAQTSQRGGIAFVEDTVRKHSERECLPGHACEHCAKLFDATFGKGTERAKEAKDDCSRHRSRFERPQTQPHFWDTSMPSSATQDPFAVPSPTKPKPQGKDKGKGNEDEEDDGFGF